MVTRRNADDTGPVPKWYLTKYDITKGDLGGPMRTPAICRYFPLERPDVAWTETETMNGGVLVKVVASAAEHAKLAADVDFIELSCSSPAALAKTTKAVLAAGFTTAEVAACVGDQSAILTLLASARSHSAVDGTGIGVVYGVRREGRRTIKDIEDTVTKLIAKG